MDNRIKALMGVWTVVVVASAYNRAKHLWGRYQMRRAYRGTILRMASEATEQEIKQYQKVYRGEQ